MSQQARILIVEDESAIRSLISFACTSANFTVMECESVMQAKRILNDGLPDLILLDYMLPEVSGIEWLEELRSQETTRKLPVIMLTARGSESDRVIGLNAGADDYVVKPFMPRELIARISAVLRRCGAVTGVSSGINETITCGPIAINEARHEVTVDSEAIALSAKEFKLLSVFVKNPERVYSREMLLTLVWDNAYVDERTVDVHMLRLRKQLAGTRAENILQTVRGLGYRAHIESESV